MSIIKIFLPILVAIWLAFLALLSFTVENFVIAWAGQMVCSLLIGGVLVVLFSNAISVRRIYAILIYIFIGIFIPPKILFENFDFFNDLSKAISFGWDAFFRALVADLFGISFRVVFSVIILWFFSFLISKISTIEKSKNNL